MNLYRVHYSWSRGSASSSDIVFYGDEDKLKADLLQHHLDILSHYNSRNWLKYVNARAWLRHLNNKDEDDYDRKIATKIYKVEKSVNDEWVPVGYKFIEPEVIL